MNRKDLGPVLTAGQLSEVRALLRQLQRSGSLLELAQPNVAALLRDIDAENDGTTVLVDAWRFDDTGDIAIPEEVVDLRLLIDCRRERDEAREECEQLRAEILAHLTRQAQCQGEYDERQRDAERYRWLRSHGLDRSNGFCHLSWYQQYDDDYPCSNDEIDAAIDAAMREGE